MARPTKNMPKEARGLIATAQNDITIPRFTTVLTPQDDTLIARGEGKGLKIYDELERDPHAYAVLQKRKFALIGRDWEIKPASDDERDMRAAELVEAVFGSINFDQLCLDLLDATLKGFSVAEIIWKRDKETIVPEKIVAHDPRRFTFDREWKLKLLTFEAPLFGVDLPERKFIVHRFGTKGNNPFGLGLGSKLFWPVLFKREGVAFWLTFLEKFASPTPVGKYPIGMLPTDQQKLLSSLEEMRQAGALVVPMGTDVDFLEATRVGQVEYAEWCKYWDTQMSLAVFGSTLATNLEGNSGSRAAAEVHKEAEDQIIDADSDLLSSTLGQTIIQWLVDYNLPGAGLPVFARLRPQNEMEVEDLRTKRAANAKAELDLLFELAGRVPADNLVELAAALAGIDLLPHIPLEVLQRLAPHLASARVNLETAAQSGQLTKDNAGSSEAVRQIAFAAARASDAHDHGASEIVDDLAKLAAPMIDDWLARIRDELDKASADDKSLEQFAARLLEIEPELTIDPLGNVIGGAVALSELRGRADVAQEIKSRKRRK